MKTSDLIWSKPNALTSDFCSHLIQKFEADSRKHQGTVGFDRVDRSIKSSMDLKISLLSDWEEEDQIFFKSLSPAIQDYAKYCAEEFNLPVLSSDTEDSGYQIQRTKPGEFYDWHHDFFIVNHQSRILTYIWYLNTITEGGYTEFSDGTKIQPETGKLLIFPSTWTYVHRGYPPEYQTKYICTGWIYSSID